MYALKNIRDLDSLFKIIRLFWLVLLFYLLVLSIYYNSHLKVVVQKFINSGIDDSWFTFILERARCRLFSALDAFLVILLVRKKRHYYFHSMDLDEDVEEKVDFYESLKLIRLSTCDAT